MSLVFEQINMGGDNNLGYLFGDRNAKTAALIDPSYNPEALIERAKQQELNIDWIINTHGHHDHVNGNAKAKELTNAKIAIYDKSTIEHDYGIKDNEKLQIGSFTLQFIFTPGHYPDHMVIYNPDFDIAMTGDHIFVGKIGRTTSEETSRLQYDSLNRVYDELPLNTTVWPGHDYGCRPSSTLALEKECNPFIRCKTVEEFLELKIHWPTYKDQNGLL
ncbi:MAG: MBL fold metallo-hydrolase [Chlamydiota bacterium]|nr:MBL fold metallo-hydrolase [Chlamydiota bacterium]